jgi:phospholipid transport system substrate-binding protein
MALARFVGSDCAKVLTWWSNRGQHAVVNAYVECLVSLIADHLPTHLVDLRGPRAVDARRRRPMTMTASLLLRHFAGKAFMIGAAVLASLSMLAAGVPASLSGSAIAQGVDPAVTYMDRAAKEIIGASRTRSLSVLQTAIMRHADLGYMGGIGLGDYRDKLVASDKQTYFTGMTRFMAKYALSESSKYEVSHLTFQPVSRAAKYGLMVDSTVHMKDGSSYDVQWMLYRQASGFKIRDAQILTFWMTPQLQRLFTNYIGENGGNVKALVVALNR